MLLELSAVFYTVDHGVLLNWLCGLGAPFYLYLFAASSRQSWLGKSLPRPLLYGVQQGGVLSFLLNIHETQVIHWFGFSIISKLIILNYIFQPQAGRVRLSRFCPSVWSHVGLDGEDLSPNSILPRSNSCGYLGHPDLGILHFLTLDGVAFLPSMLVCNLGDSLDSQFLLKEAVVALSGSSLHSSIWCIIWVLSYIAGCFSHSCPCSTTLSTWGYPWRPPRTFNWSRMQWCKQ